MRGLPLRIGSVLIVAVLLGLMIAPGVSAADDISESMCGLFSKREVRAALDQKRQAPRPDVYSCYWSSPEIGDPQRDLAIGWTDHPMTLDAIKASFADTNLASGAVPLVVGGRPAMYAGGPGQGYLYLELDQGILVLSISDFEATDWRAALTELGEVAATRGDTLVPLPPADDVLTGLFPTTLGGAPVVTVPNYPGRVFPAGSDMRKALDPRLKAQGRSFGDVSMAFGGPITALRIAGGDAAAFTDNLVQAMGIYSGFTKVPEEVAAGTIGVVTGPNDLVIYVYPRDDVVWGVVADGPLLTEALAALPGAPAPPVVPEPTPTASADLSTPEGYLTSLLQFSVGGLPLDVQVFAADGSFTPQAQKSFKAVLQKQGKTLGDLAIVVASNASATQIQGFRIAGGDAAPLEKLALEQLRSSGMVSRKTKPQPVEVAGKAMRRIKTAFGDGYLYPKDDVLWVVQAPDDATLTEVFTALP